MHWIKEHKPLATSEDVGKSLQEAQNLMKKHQVQLTINALDTIFFTAQNNVSVRDCYMKSATTSQTLVKSKVELRN